MRVSSASRWLVCFCGDSKTWRWFVFVEIQKHGEGITIAIRSP
jgi:hypothetical protein